MGFLGKERKKGGIEGQEMPGDTERKQEVQGRKEVTPPDRM